MQEICCAVKRVGERAVSGLPRVLSYLVTARCQLADLAHIARGSRDLPSLTTAPRPPPLPPSIRPAPLGRAQGRGGGRARLRGGVAPAAPAPTPPWRAPAGTS